ncbi:MAG: D-alanine-D-alanine ligase [candidate division TM6 bacterium GW2011_GWF2_37_49]|nr:MAG: D-alanine-D-alanine ligase [candidate division TM6 bacterium GW2011_GWF2_37_49]
MHAVQAASKLRVGVFFGGKSIEREVSLNSGRTICDHLDTDKYTIIPIFQDEDGTLYLFPWHFLHRGKISDFQSRLAKEAKKITCDDLKNIVDFIYLAAHGRFAEDGTIQGMLEVLGIPYLGSKIFGSALGMDKAAQKDVFKSSGIDVAKGAVVKGFDVNNITTEEIINKLKKENVELPCIVKPAHEGSSMGVSKITSADELLPAIIQAAYVDPRRVQDVIVEEKIDGMEFVCVALQKVKRHGNNVEVEWFTLPITEVVPEGDSVFDYEQKYMPGRARKITPARCSAENLDRIAQTCIKASAILNFSTISRIDGFLAADGRIVLIDPNTLTGMSPATFLFHQAAEFGMSHTQLINYLIETELKLAGMLEIKNSAIEGDDLVAKENENKKIRVAVLLGGNTNEREISLESGRNICYKLSPQKYECLPIFVSDSMQLYKLSQSMLLKNSTREISEFLEKAEKIGWADLPEICDFVFIGLHGGLGEGGGVQGTLEMLGLPYNGSGVLASALCMDKFKTNNFLKHHGLEVPVSSLINVCDWQNKSNEEKIEVLASHLQNLQYPLILKPHDDGCSVFVKKATDTQDLINNLDEYFEKSNKKIAMIEELIVGTELTCGVIGNDDKVMALAPSMAVAKGGILSIKEKFLPGDGENQTPAPLPKEILELVRETMVVAYKAIGCAGYARIDCFYQNSTQSPTGKDRVIILEFNTLPGMTPATCIFHQAAEHGMKPMDFIDKIIELGFQNHAEKITVLPSEKIDDSCVQESKLRFEELKDDAMQEKSVRKKQKPPKASAFDAPDQESDSFEFKVPKDDFTMKLF